MCYYDNDNEVLYYIVQECKTELLLGKLWTEREAGHEIDNKT